MVMKTPLAVFGSLAVVVSVMMAPSGATAEPSPGRAISWGLNVNGSLGNNTTANSSVPVAVDTSGVLVGKTITSISAGGLRSCAVADGKAYCWGYNLDGQLGNNNTTSFPVRSPVAVNTAGALSSKTVTAITAGNYHSCAVADGRAYCWGNNNNGELGQNTFTDSSVPVAVNTTGVLAGRTITSIAAGSSHSCAAVEGRAACWGNNAYGQMGDNTTTQSPVPVPVTTSGVLGTRTVTTVGAGSALSCAVADGQAYCWGFNGSGQLGNGTTTQSLMPVRVDTSGALAGKTVSIVATGDYHAAVLAAAPPQAPSAVTGSPGDREVSVSWVAPGDDGGSPVLEYVATAVPGGATCSTSGTTCTVPGLTNGTPYTFTVTARNAIGVSSPSAPSSPVVPVVPEAASVRPGKVKGVKVKVRKGAAKATWKPTAGATSYEARISKPGGKKFKKWKTTSKRVFKAKVRKARSTASRSLRSRPAGADR